MAKFRILLLIPLLASCVAGSSQDCAAVAAELEQCAGAVSDEFIAHCEADVDAALAVVDSACSGGSKSDFLGKSAGESCFNFNFECAEGLTCSPTDADESSQRCATPRSYGEFCDDDADCGQGLACAGETLSSAGTCELYTELVECEVSEDCPAGKVCRYTDDDDTGFCLPPGRFGDSCNESADCGARLKCRSNGFGGGLCTGV